VHEDPLLKSKRVTNSSGSVVSTVELDPWGGNTNRSSNDAFQPHKFNNYERDINQSDDAMFRRYNRWWSRFDQPDPYDGSYDLTNPQSFNRYAYAQNDPVNNIDPLGLDPEDGGGVGSIAALAIGPSYGPVTAYADSFNGVDGGGDVIMALHPLGRPQNPAITKQGGPCDRKIRDIFADDDAQAAASGFEPTGFSDAWRNGQDRSRAGGPLPNQWGHLNGYSAHIYGSSPGTSDTTLYVPGNFDSYTRPSGNDAVATFHYAQLGNQTNVTLAVYHVANFGIQRNNRNEAGSVRIGMSGGPGGQDFGYRHSHLEVHSGRGLPPFDGRNRTRQFFSRVFCQ
jgi:RHS repeat-associated protein